MKAFEIKALKYVAALSVAPRYHPNVPPRSKVLFDGRTGRPSWYGLDSREHTRVCAHFTATTTAKGSFHSSPTSCPPSKRARSPGATERGARGPRCPLTAARPQRRGPQRAVPIAHRRRGGRAAGCAPARLRRIAQPGARAALTAEPAAAHRCTAIVRAAYLHADRSLHTHSAGASRVRQSAGAGLRAEGGWADGIRC